MIIPKPDHNFDLLVARITRAARGNQLFIAHLYSSEQLLIMVRRYSEAPVAATSEWEMLVAYHIDSAFVDHVRVIVKFTLDMGVG